jgi:hypothetical protein
MLTIKKFIALVFACVAVSQPAWASYFPTTIAAADDSNAFLQLGEQNSWVAGIFHEEGSGSGGFNGVNEHRPLGRIYSETESFLTMLRSPRGAVRTNLLATVPVGLLTAPDLGGTRGAIDIGGHLYHRQVTMAASVNLQFIKIIPGFIDMAFYLPCVSKRFDAITVNRRTTAAVDLVDVQLDQIMQNMSDFLQTKGNLSMEPWQGAGLGDPTLIFRWNWPREFAQEDIRNAMTQVYWGIQIPVSKARDADKMFSQPLGNDGHWGFPLGAGFELGFAVPIKIGFGIDVLLQVAESHDLRVKTDVRQSSLLLLHRIRAQRKPGLTWRVNWFAEGVKLWRGLSLRGGYEFIMHYNDVLNTTEPGYKVDIINTSETLQDWFLNLLTATIKYDLSSEFAGAPVKPFVQGFLKFPLSGRRALNANTVGFQVSVRF